MSTDEVLRKETYPDIFNEPAKSLKKTHNQYCKQENIHTIISKEVESVT